jgi:citryl-CoA lyase
MQWKTSVSHIKDGKEIIRGRELSELIVQESFADAIFFLLRGAMPAKKESAMMNALLVAAIDHGTGTASAMTARIVASAKNSMHTALAAGILAMGEAHGGAIEGAAKFFDDHKREADIHGLVQRMKDAKERIPGYGHAVLSRDERAELLFSLAKQHDCYGEHCAFAESVGKSLNAVSSKELPLNIDGAMAAILSDMGFDWRMARGIFIIARMPGLVAHVYEELAEGSGLRRTPENDIQYTGA